MSAFLARGGTITKVAAAGWGERGGVRAPRVRPADVAVPGKDEDEDGVRQRSSERSLGLRGPARPAGGRVRRSRTIPLKRLDREVRKDRGEYELPDERRPLTRGECLDGPRPCPWAGCRHHIALEVTESGSIKYVFGEDFDWTGLEHTCSLDVADMGGATLEDVGAVLGLTRERARQVEVIALEKMQDTGLGLGA